MSFSNVYEDRKRAEAYSKLEFPGTYYLAYRDLPQIIMRHVKGKNGVDFGCGTGRSTRFLAKLGFNVLGIDISEDMINKARELDPKGDYLLTRNDDFGLLKSDAYDLVLSVFAFDNIPGMENKVRIFRGLAKLLKKEGCIVNVVSSPRIYLHEWASFSTRDFPDNKSAKSGEVVRIIQLDTEDRRPVEDILWSDKCYLETYARSGLEIVARHEPLGKSDDRICWVNERVIAPWVIFVLKKV